MFREVTFDEYQNAVMDLAMYPRPDEAGALSYVALGLVGEAGECAEKVKKLLRDQNGMVPDQAWRDALAREIGDVLWYCTAMAHEIGFDLKEIASWNLDKLEARKAKGTLHGDGDDR